MILGRFPYPTYRRIRHVVIVWVTETITLYLLSQWLPGLVISSEFDAFLAVALIGLLNAFLRPLILYLTMSITVLTLGLFSFLLNIVVILLVAYIMPGFNIIDFPTVIYVVLGITFINLLASNLLALDENDSYYRSVIPRIKPENLPPESSQPAGLIIIEIDGLSYNVLRKALDLGYMPTMRNLLSEDYQIEPWNCGLPSQSSSSQLGILYGENANIPAFRWYEKDRNKLVVSNRLSDTAMLEQRFNHLPGLLQDASSSLANMFSGNASRAVLTMSKLSQFRKFPKGSGHFFNFFLNPYNYIHTILLMMLEFFREFYQSSIQIITRRTPRIRRTFLFAIERAISAVLIRELTTHLLIEDMFRGEKTIYATYIGYDVVAHHTGVASPGAMTTLRDIDKQIQRIIYAIENAPRIYEIVFISDHGHSQGAPFQQLYGITLEQLIRKILKDQYTIRDTGASEETKGYVNTLLHLALAPHRKLNKAAQRLYEQYKKERGEYFYFDISKQDSSVQKSDIVLCVSGSLAMLYFTNFSQRLYLENMNIHFPGLIEALLCHPGIGFIAVESIVNGPVVINAKGMYYLNQKDYEGINPLVMYEDNAASQLKKLFSYSNIGDLIIQSQYDKHSDQISAFENLLAHHGGIGGDQTQSFVMHPQKLPFTGQIDDATKMHFQLLEWQKIIFNKQE
jgi:putative membrane protein